MKSKNKIIFIIILVNSILVLELLIGYIYNLKSNNSNYKITNNSENLNPNEIEFNTNNESKNIQNIKSNNDFISSNTNHEDNYKNYLDKTLNLNSEKKIIIEETNHNKTLNILVVICKIYIIL